MRNTSVVCAHTNIRVQKEYHRSSGVSSRFEMDFTHPVEWILHNPACIDEEKELLDFPSCFFFRNLLRYNHSNNSGRYLFVSEKFQKQYESKFPMKTEQ